MSMRHIFYGGNGSMLVDSGPPFPDEGKFFCVNENGDLLFFRYDGDGERDPSGAKGFTGPGNNSGNQIGNGFLNFRHIVGIGDRKFLAIRDNGDLLYFHYTANGEQDPTGTNGFVGEGNNSGNQIGNGFQSMRHLFGGVTSHRPPASHRFAHHLFTVAGNGDLLFFRYEGNGEQDPSGTLGFTGPSNPNSGNQIGNGF